MSSKRTSTLAQISPYDLRINEDDLQFNEDNLQINKDKEYSYYPEENVNEEVRFDQDQDTPRNGLNENLKRKDRELEQYALHNLIL